MRRPSARLLLPVLVAAGIALAHPWDVASPADIAGAGSSSVGGPSAASNLASLAPVAANAAVQSSDPAAVDLIDPVASPGAGAVSPPKVLSGDAMAPPSSISPTIATLPQAAERRRLQNDLVPADPSTLTGYVWPLPHARITLPFGSSPFGSWLVDGGLFHDGVDLATFCGDRIVAAHAGTVLAAGRHFDSVLGWVGDLGPYFARLDAKSLWFELPIAVVIDDGNTYRSVYAHFSKVVVKAGQHVHAGQLLGYEGRTGNASGCHLHFGLFSQYESATYSTDPGTVKRMKLPAAEIARIDPLLVLPPRHMPPSTAEPPDSELLGLDLAR